MSVKITAEEWIEDNIHDTAWFIKRNLKDYENYGIQHSVDEFNVDAVVADLLAEAESYAARGLLSAESTVSEVIPGERLDAILFDPTNAAACTEGEETGNEG